MLVGRLAELNRFAPTKRVHAACLPLLVAVVACGQAPREASMVAGDGGASTPSADGPLVPPAPLVLAYEHACLLDPAGSIRCAGNKTAGQLGDGHTAKLDCPWGCDYAFDAGCMGYARCQSKATSVVDVRDATQVQTDGYRTCALRASGTVVCWGPNGGNAVHLDPNEACTPDDPRIRCAPTPVDVGLTGVRSIAIADGRFCVLDLDGGVRCTEPAPASSERTRGRLHPATVQFEGLVLVKQPLPPAVSLGAGASFWCAKTIDGSVWCDGIPQEPPATPNTPTHPERVSGLDLTTVVQLVVSTAHACALDAVGAVRCWGAAFYGGLGRMPPCETETCGTDYHPPALVPGIPKMRRIDAGPSGTCGIAEDDSLWCWGVYSRTAKYAPEQLADDVPWVALGRERVCWLDGQKLVCHAGRYDEVSEELATLFATR